MFSKISSQYTFSRKSHPEGCRGSNSFTLWEKSFNAVYAILLPQTSLHRGSAAANNESCSKDYWSSARCCCSKARSVSRIWQPRPYFILLGRLSTSYLGFSRTMLKRFSSYLTGRTQSVFIVNTTSSKPNVRIWSSARVDTWTSLVHPICGTCSRHNLCSMFYADDHDSQRYNLLLILLIDVMPWTPFSWAQFFQGWLALTRS